MMTWILYLLNVRLRVTQATWFYGFYQMMPSRDESFFVKEICFSTGWWSPKIYAFLTIFIFMKIFQNSQKFSGNF